MIQIVDSMTRPATCEAGRKVGGASGCARIRRPTETPSSPTDRNATDGSFSAGGSPCLSLRCALSRPLRRDIMILRAPPSPAPGDSDRSRAPISLEAGLLVGGGPPSSRLTTRVDCIVRLDALSTIQRDPQHVLSAPSLQRRPWRPGGSSVGVIELGGSCPS